MWLTDVFYPSGTLTKGMTLYNVNRHEKERVSKLELLYASEPESVDELSVGSIGVVLGLRHTRTGDTLISAYGPGNTAVDTNSTALREITPPPAVVSASVIPNSYADLQPVQEALVNLTRTDPSARVEEQEGQLLLNGLGALHLEIVEGRLRDEWGAQFQLGRRRVSYREGFAGPEMGGLRSYETQVGGQTAWAKIDLAIRPFKENELGLSTWDGNIIVDTKGDPLPSPESMRDRNSPLGCLIQGLSSTLSNSHRTGLPRSHLHITVRSYALSDAAPPYVLASGASHILRDMLNESGMGPLMEPYVRVKVEVSEEIIGKVVKDLTEHRGEIMDLGGAASGFSSNADEYDAEPYAQEGLYVPPEWLTPCSAMSNETKEQRVRLKRSIHAVAPLSQMLDYSARLRAMSGGHGTFDMVSEGFREVNEVRKMEILKELGRA